MKPEFVEHAPSTPFRLISRRVASLVGLMLVVAVLVTGTVLLVSSGGSSGSPSSHPVSNSVGGPNEALRGQAAAAAAGAPTSLQATGGPNEALRGQAAASAASR